MRQIVLTKWERMRKAGAAPLYRPRKSSNYISPQGGRGRRRGRIIKSSRIHRNLPNHFPSWPWLAFGQIYFTKGQIPLAIWRNTLSGADAFITITPISFSIKPITFPLMMLDPAGIGDYVKRFFGNLWMHHSSQSCRPVGVSHTCYKSCTMSCSLALFHILDL